MSKSALRIRHMTPGDIEAGMRLKRFAGWNQTPADWQSFLEIEPEGCYVAEINGLVVGTGTAFRYGRDLAWIGMILVDPEYRRRGIATEIMAQCIQYLDDHSCRCIKLDATDAGAEVYGRLGFHVEYHVGRWRRAPLPVSSDRIEEVRPFDTQLVDTLGAWDHPRFGADRTRLLDWYSNKAGKAWLVVEEERLQGYAMCRPGEHALQIGPLVADDSETASLLAERMLLEYGSIPLIADLIDSNSEAVSLFESFGFERFRVLKRMFRGNNHCPGEPGKIYCLAGFEFG